jgi:phage host-nuclease inhibitor protein Gam
MAAGNGQRFDDDAPGVSLEGVERAVGERANLLVTFALIEELQNSLFLWREVKHGCRPTLVLIIQERERKRVTAGTTRAGLWLAPMKTAAAPQKPTPIHDKQGAAAAVKRGAELVALLGCAVAARDANVLAAQARSAALIAQLERDIKTEETRLEAWAKNNRQEFGTAQSLEFPEGVLVFHKSGRSLKLIEGWDWESVLAAMKGFWRKYLRPKVEIEKRALLADSAGDRPKLTAGKLGKIGVTVAQEEVFRAEFRAVPETLKTRSEHT